MSPKNQHFKAQEESPVPAITDEEIRRTVVRFHKDLTEIKTALIGNEMGTEGIIPRLEAVETQSKVHEKQFIIYGAYSVCICTGIGIFAKLFKLL